MSVSGVIACLKECGGEATLQELEARTSHVTIGLRRLMRQGYVERVARGRYRFTDRGQSL